MAARQRTPPSSRDTAGEAQPWNSPLDHIGSDILSLQVNLEQLLERLEDSENERADLDVSIGDLLEQKAQLQTQLTESTSNLAGVQAERKELQTVLAALEAKSTGSERKLIDENGVLTTRLGTLTQELESLREEKKQWQARQAELEAAIQQVNQQLAEQKTQFAGVTSRIEEYKDLGAEFYQRLHELYDLSLEFPTKADLFPNRASVLEYYPSHIYSYLKNFPDGQRQTEARRISDAQDRVIQTYTQLLARKLPGADPSLTQQWQQMLAVAQLKHGYLEDLLPALGNPPENPGETKRKLSARQEQSRALRPLPRTLAFRPLRAGGVERKRPARAAFAAVPTRLTELGPVRVQEPEAKIESREIQPELGIPPSGPTAFPPQERKREAAPGGGGRRTPTGPPALNPPAQTTAPPEIRRSGRVISKPARFRGETDGYYHPFMEQSDDDSFPRLFRQHSPRRRWLSTSTKQTSRRQNERRYRHL